MRTRKARDFEPSEIAEIEAMPAWIEPQLSHAVDNPPEGPEWVHELKLDGYRLHARVAGKDIRLLTRNGLNWTHRYPSIADALSNLRVRSAYLDGELCVFRPDGTTSFSDLQAATEAHHSVRLTYVGFDLLFLDGRNIAQLPLLERKSRLQKLLAGAPANVRYGEHVVGHGGEFFRAASAHHVEGVVSKPLNAPYRPGDRRLRRKAKCFNREEFVIVGFTDPDGARAHFGALLLGYYDTDGRLLFAGRAGTGFSDMELRSVHAKLKPLVVPKMPLAAMPPKGGRAGFGKPLDFRKVHWVKPKLVCEVNYLTWTADGLLRAVSYEGLREDKTAKEVTRPGPRRRKSGS